MVLNVYNKLGFIVDKISKHRDDKLIINFRCDTKECIRDKAFYVEMDHK